MKRIAPVILVAAVALIALGLFMRQEHSRGGYTEDQQAWADYAEGEAMLQSFRYAEADSLLEAAIARDPGLSMAHAALAESKARQRFGDAAKVHYARADSLAELVADPDARLLLQVRLSNAKVSRFFEQSDSLLTAARAVDPDHIIVLLTEAGRAAQAEDLQRAEELYSHILEINPNYAGAYNFLGYLYLAQGKYDDAENAMRRYAFVAPELANPHDSLGEVLMTVGRFEEAETEFRTALAKDPAFFYSLKNLGWIFLMRGQTDKALDLLGQVLHEMEGTNMGESIELELIDRLFAQRQADDLERYAADYLARNADHSGAPAVMIRQRLATGQVASALTVVDSVKAVYMEKDWWGENQLTTNYIEANELRYRALAAEQLGAHQEAAAYFQEVLERNADHSPHILLFDRVHLAYNLVPLRAYDEARVQIAEVMRVNRRIPEAALVAAGIAAASGEITEAHRLLDALDRILERADPDFPVLLDAQRLREELPDPDRI